MYAGVPASPSYFPSRSNCEFLHLWSPHWLFLAVSVLACSNAHFGLGILSAQGSAMHCIIQRQDSFATVMLCALGLGVSPAGYAVNGTFFTDLFFPPFQ